MPASQLSNLPEPLRLQAIKVRRSRNISNGIYDAKNDNNQNNQNNQANLPVFNYNNNNNQQHQKQQDDTEEEDESEESEDEEEKDVEETSTQYRTRPAMTQPTVSSMSMDSFQSQNLTPFNSMEMTQELNPQPYPPPAQNVNLQPTARVIPTQKYNNFPTNNAPQGYNERIPLSQQIPLSTGLADNGEPRQSVHTYINVQELIPTEKPKRRSCSLFSLLMLIIIGIFIVAPIKNTIPLSRQYGTKYCDTHGTSIKEQGATKDCLPCPVGAVKCFNGTASCQLNIYIFSFIVKPVIH